MEWLLRQSRTETMARATIENSTSAVIFHSEGESAKRPKAAPRFSTWVRRKNPGMTWMLSCREMFLATAHFAARSRTIDQHGNQEVEAARGMSRHSDLFKARHSHHSGWPGLAHPPISFSTALQRSHTVG